MDADLALLLAFLETRDTDDALVSGERAAAWLHDRRLLGREHRVSDEDARALRRVRAALLAVLRDRANADMRTLETLSSALSGGLPRVAVSEAGALRIEPGAEGVAGAAGAIVLAAHRVALRGDFDRLKLCRACEWPFVDLSRNHSRVWCDMAKCGAQVKVRAYRQRKKAAANG